MSGVKVAPGVAFIKNQKPARTFEQRVVKHDLEGFTRNEFIILGSPVVAAAAVAVAVKLGGPISEFTQPHADAAAAIVTLQEGTCPSPYAGPSSISNPATALVEQPVMDGVDLALYGSTLYPQVGSPTTTVERGYVCTGTEEYSFDVAVMNPGPNAVNDALLTIRTSTEAGLHVDQVNNVFHPENSPRLISIDPSDGHETWDVGSVPPGEQDYDIKVHADKPADNQFITGQISPGNSTMQAPDGSLIPVVDDNSANDSYTFKFRSIDSTQHQAVTKINKPVLFANMRMGNCEASGIAIKVPKGSVAVKGLSYKLSSKTAVFSTKVNQKLKHNMLVQFGNIQPGKFAIDSFMACFKSTKKPFTAKLTVKAKELPTSNYQASFRATNAIKGGRWAVKPAPKSKVK